MTHDRNPAFDPWRAPGDGATEMALTDLAQAYAAVPPPELKQVMDRAVYDRMAAAPMHVTPARRARRLMRGTGMRIRLAALVAAVLLALSGTVGYLTQPGAAPASARALLRDAATALAPNQAAHFTYTITVAPGNAKLGSVAADVWVQTDANGTPVRAAQTLDTGANAAANSRYVQIGQQIYAYDANHQAILLAPSRIEDPSWLVPTGVLDGAGIAQALAALQQRSPEQVELLPEQTLDGVKVDVLQVNGWTERPAQQTTFYFDAQTHLLRGFDTVSNDPSYPTPAWQARLASYATMPVTSVPAQTFSLNAPATARIDAGSPDLSIFASACHASTSAKAILAAGQQSLLAACQATAPTVTQAELVDAFLAPTRAALDAAVAAGQITPAQEADGLAQQQGWLNTFVTSLGGGSSS